MVDDKTYRIGVRTKQALDILVRTGDVKFAVKESGVTNFAATLRKSVIQRWILRKREFAATKEDFNDDEYFAFLIRSIRGEETEMDSKAFGKRLRAAEIYGRGKGMGGESDIGTIRFIMPGQNDRVQAKPDSS